MKLFSKAAGVIAAALLITGGVAPVAQSQPNQVVTPEQQDSYIQQFHHEGDTPPVVDGVGGYTDAEIAEIHDAIQQAQESGAPNDKLIPGEMWSDKVELPATIDKAAADEAEIAIAQQQSQPQARTLAAASCQTFWPSPYQVCGAILERYIQQGAQFGWMLLPSENQALNPDGQGYRQRFMTGFIYWHPTTGAHAVNNYSAQVWERNGWETGWMGYPTGGEVPVTGSNPIDGELSGWVQTFQGGRVYRSPVLDGFQVASINGVILDKWLDLGGPNSNLGFPIADEAKTADGVGRFSLFQYGSIYWHPSHGAHEVEGLIYEAWAKANYEGGTFGYPTSDSHISDDYRFVQNFEGGVMDLETELEKAGTISIGGIEVNNLFVSLLLRRGIPTSSIPDLTWSSSPTGISSLSIDPHVEITNQESDTVSTLATSGLPPWSACATNASPDKVIRTWTGLYGKHRGERIDLTCGKHDYRNDRGNGFFHIKARHMGQWQTLGAVEGLGWMDLANMAITKSVMGADYWKNNEDPKRDSTCYSGQIYLVNKVTGAIADTRNPSVVVSNGNNTIVTAFPHGKCSTH